MDEHKKNDLENILREQGIQYIVDSQGLPQAVLLSMNEYLHYLDLLDDEADDQDKALAERLSMASVQPTGGERQSFRDYLETRQATSG
jgi:hypothetical protein